VESEKIVRMIRRSRRTRNEKEDDGVKRGKE
jgi:hypothetical protein